MLKSLQHYSLREREAILASVAQHLLPQPFPDTDGLTGEEEDVLNEIRDELELLPDDDSREAKTKVLHVLSAEMSEFIDSQPKLQEQIRARLEQRFGSWPPDYTRVLYTTAPTVLAEASNHATELEASGEDEDTG